MNNDLLNLCFFILQPQKIEKIATNLLPLIMTLIEVSSQENEG